MQEQAIALSLNKENEDLVVFHILDPDPNNFPFGTTVVIMQ